MPNDPICDFLVDSPLISKAEKTAEPSNPGLKLVWGISLAVRPKYRRRAGKAAFWAVFSAPVILSPIYVRIRPAQAEFEIPEVNVEAGSVSAEYRGAAHQGVPPPDRFNAEENLRQSHELEFQLAPTNYWMFRITPDVSQPVGGALEFTDFNIESQFVLHPRPGDGYGVALIVGYTTYFGNAYAAAPEFEVGPVIEYAKGPWLLTLNPMLERQRGTYAQPGTALEYATQLQYRFAAHWAAAAQAFGQIDDLAHTGPANEQIHRAGPTLYWFSSDEGAAEGDPDFLDTGSVKQAAWKVGVGCLFGMTDATPDVSFKMMGAVDY